VTDDALFPDTGLRAVPVEELDLAEGERLRRRQAARIAAGQHPLAMHAFIPLHPSAPRDAAPDDGRDYPRCGTCRFRTNVGGHARSFPKCVIGYSVRDLTPAEIAENAGTIYQHATRKVTEGPRMSSSAASDVRAWWPGCDQWEAADGA
jgi:hypothetical protein